MLLHPTLYIYIWHKLLVTKTVASMVKRKYSTRSFYLASTTHYPCVAVCLYLWAGWPGRVSALHPPPRPHASPPARPGRVRRSPGQRSHQSSRDRGQSDTRSVTCDSGDIHRTHPEINTSIVIKSQWKDRVLSKKKQQQWKIVLCFAVFNPKSSVLEMIRVQ